MLGHEGGREGRGRWKKKEEETLKELRSGRGRKRKIKGGKEGREGKVEMNC